MGSGEPELVLLGFWPSMFDVRVRIALAEKGIKYEYIQEQDLFNNKSPLLLKLNPVHKKIPVLIHNGNPICESKIIVEYIDDSWKADGDSSPLLPSDPYLRSQARFWGDYIDKQVYDSGKKVWNSKGEDMKKGAQELVGVLKVLEEELGEKPYFMGETFGYVDIALMSYYSHLLVYETLAGCFSIKNDCPKLFAWATRCMARGSVSNTLPDRNKLYETTIAYRKTLGLED